MEQIYDEETLLKELNEHKGMTLSFMLDIEQVEEWKQKGHFVFLRKELINLPKAKFACVEHEDGQCSYYFVLNTEKLADRVLTMLIETYKKNAHVPLVKCQCSERVGGKPLRYGTVKACRMF